MGRNARKRISYGASTGAHIDRRRRFLVLPRALRMLTLWCTAVLPLANSAGGHRLGVNGLAVDPANSILYVTCAAVVGRRRVSR